MISKSELMSKAIVAKRHVVILGAGASKQAFPQGNANGHSIPTMDELISILGLENFLKEKQVRYLGSNFEQLYSSLYGIGKYSEIIQELEQRVYKYFSQMRLPQNPTLYDHLLYCLQPKDFIASFNWDPFLFDAWRRNESIIATPSIVYLHGNVRIGTCLDHKIYGEIGRYCPNCNRPLSPIKLLYPIANKDYDDDPFIKDQWVLLRQAIEEAFTITIFGYGAPKTDIKAVEIMKEAWNKEERFIERIEVIDTKNWDLLRNQWDPFIIRTYFDHHKDFYDSKIAQFPRRSCEQLYYATVHGEFVENYPIPKYSDFESLYHFIKPALKAENY